MTPPALILFAACLTSAAPVAKAGDDVARLQGTWWLTREVSAGKTYEYQDRNHINLVIKANSYTLVAGRGKTKVPYTFTLDPDRMPRELNLSALAGRLKGTTYPCIYKLEGDTFTTCTGLAGKERPGDFESSAENGYRVEVWKKKR